MITRCLANTICARTAGGRAILNNTSRRQEPRNKLTGVVLSAVALAAMLSCFGDGVARAAESYPSKPIRLLSGFAPGGGSDIVGRAIAQKLAERWEHPMVVDNRPGAGGTIAMTLTARSAPDGYTLMMLSGSQITNASLFTKLPYDMVKALAPITQVTTQSYLLLTHPSVAATSVHELIELIKTRPEQLNFGSSGTGSVTHLGMELFSILAGVKLAHVPYKGSGQVLIGLLGNEVQLALATTISGIKLVRSGKLRALATTGTKRPGALPDLPTVAESGLPDYEVTGWYGVVTPAGTPAAIIGTLNREIISALRDQKVQQNLANQGADPVGNSEGEFSIVIRNEIAKWTRVVKARGIRMEGSDQ